MRTQPNAWAKAKVVMGGLKPGITTDAVAALVAERLNADLLVKGTDQEGVYDKDPRKHTDAVKLDHLTFEDLPKISMEGSTRRESTRSLTQKRSRFSSAIT